VVPGDADDAGKTDDDTGVGDDDEVSWSKKVTLVSHCANNVVPPWLVAANELEVDLGVANW
jgi:hypothetical protein